MVKKLRAEKSSIEQELANFKNNEKEKFTLNTKHWEQTCNDLTREINSYQGEINEKD